MKTHAITKWDRNQIDHRNHGIPKEFISVFYDSDDNVLFGSTVTKGLVSYHYVRGEHSVDGKPIFLHSSIEYDGKGNKDCPNPELIKDFEDIKRFLET